MSAGTESTGTLGIVDLVDVCRDMRSRNRALFGQIGEWVADESDPALQRWFAVGSHRHAWHADLWDERLPKIPMEGGRDSVLITTGRADAYRQHLEQMVADLDELSPRIDATLDPSTARVVTLVRADLVDLLDRAPT
ncbi:MAG: hypothetical protein RIB65_19455 [Ilumatobacter fluminis]|uniref:hypothetical protein n=1 Tax=Ilumatobacter fluminis TaxID=467091 RepID=UPI0032EAF823